MNIRPGNRGDIRSAVILSVIALAILASQACAQTFEMLYSFQNARDVDPYSLVSGSDGNIYGITAGNGTNLGGTLFKMTVGGAVTTLASIIVDPEESATLIQGKDGNLYGTTPGDETTLGTVFRMTTNGAVTTLTVFKDSGGALPSARSKEATALFTARRVRVERMTKVLYLRWERMVF